MSYELIDILKGDSDFSEMDKGDQQDALIAT